MKKNILIFLVLILLGFSSSSLYAHYLWLVADRYNVTPGSVITISVGWGHKFPKDAQPRKEMIKRMKLFLIGPNNKKTFLKVEVNGDKGVKPVRIKLKNKGTYLAVLEMKSFVTKTVDGYFYKPKNELENVLESKWYESTSIAVINVRNSEDKYFYNKIPEIKDSDFFIKLLENPVLIREKALLPVAIISKTNEPVRSYIYATYAGFSNDKDTFAWASRTNKKGLGKIKILKNGLWLLKTEYITDFLQHNLADKTKYLSTLTFQIQ
jgi:uncharacterized GH25 family protein